MNYKEKKRVQDREESEGEEGEITYIMLNLNSWKLCIDLNFEFKNRASSGSFVYLYCTCGYWFEIIGQ